MEHLTKILLEKREKNPKNIKKRKERRKRRKRVYNSRYFDS